MRDIAAIREHPGKILAVGSYKPGYQAILDFDALCGRESPSIVAIVGSNKRFEKYFWTSKFTGMIPAIVGIVRHLTPDLLFINYSPL